MKTFARWALLAASAALGIGVAVYLAVTLEAPQAQPASPLAGPSAAKTRAKDPSPRRGRSPRAGRTEVHRQARSPASGEPRTDVRPLARTSAGRAPGSAARPAGAEPAPLAGGIHAPDEKQDEIEPPQLEQPRLAQPRAQPAEPPAERGLATSALLEEALAELAKDAATANPPTPAPGPDREADRDHSRQMARAAGLWGAPGPDKESDRDDEGDPPRPPLPSEPAPDKPAPEATITPAPGHPEGDDRLAADIQDEDIRTVLKLLSQQGGLNILASGSVQGKVSAALNDVTAEAALEAILKSTGYIWRREGNFIYVGTPQDFEKMETSLDRIGTRVYRPNYVTAQDLHNLILPLLSTGPIPGKSSVTAPSDVGLQTGSTDAGGDSFASSEAVLVQDYEAVLAEIDQIVKEIDKRPAQVAIEAMILSVKLDDTNKFGIDFQVLRDKNNVRFGWGNPRVNPLEGGGMTDGTTGGKIGEFAFDTGGLKFAFLDSDLGVFLNALETIGDTNVVARPHLLCLNKQRAEILIGSQLGYISTTITETTAAQNVEFLEVGAQLRLRPFISSDGSIRMEVHPELSTGQVRIEGGFTLPDKDVTQVTTNIMVRDGCTVIIGGLMREDLATSTSQVPLMGSLPVLGPLFRNKTETVERREILVLLTPRIVYEPETCHQGDLGAEGFLDRQAVYTDKMSPIGKRFLGRKNFRQAQAAWAAGDREAALGFIDRSIHFDPLSREAIELGGDIRAGVHRGHVSPGAELPGDPGGHPLDGEQIAPWLLERLEAGGGEPAVPRHPLDPGQPGYRVEIERPEVMDDGRD